MSTDIATSAELHLPVWFDKNRPRLIKFGLIAAVVAAVVAWFIYHKGQTEAAASAAVSNVTVGPGSSEAYLKIAADYPGTAAAERAIVLAAGEYFSEGKYAEAQTQFERIAREFPASQLRAQAALGSAASLFAQGKGTEAVTAYNEVIQRYSDSPSALQARSGLAQAYESQGKFAEALGLYQELSHTEANGTIGLQAGVRLQALLAAHPELLPKPVAPPVAATSTPVNITTNTPAPAQ